MLLRVILATENAPRQRRLRQAIAQPDVVVEATRGKDGLWERIATRSCDLMVVDEALIPRPIHETVALFTELPDSPGIVVLLDREDAEERAKFLAAGCDAVLNPDVPGESLAEALGTILAKRLDAAETELVARPSLAEPRLGDFVSQSPAMHGFMQLVERVVNNSVPLLFLGETGVGKERLARAIHAEGPRSDGPFIAVNCGALPESLLESELFGHEEGSFTGATRARRGWFELAHRGTIFLDEIGDLPIHLQVKLLRVLQDHHIQRVGSEQTLKVDVRVMAATNRDLEQEIEQQRFRKDLYYRLGVVVLAIPPLRERREDIPELAESYINYFRPLTGCNVFGIAGDALQALTQYDWPGNVRELMNVIERGMLLCDSSEISLADLPSNIAAGQLEPSPEAPPTGTGPWPLSKERLSKPLGEARQEVLDEFERSYLTGLLELTGGRIGETAKRAGIQPRSLFGKMKRFGLRKEDFRQRDA